MTDMLDDAQTEALLEENYVLREYVKDLHDELDYLRGKIFSLMYTIICIEDNGY